MKEVPLRIGLSARLMHDPPKELGFRGVELCTNVRGVDLTRAGLEKFFARVEELGLLIFLHPFGTSLVGPGAPPANILASADVLLPHGNRIDTPDGTVPLSPMFPTPAKRITSSSATTSAAATAAPRVLRSAAWAARRNSAGPNVGFCWKILTAVREASAAPRPCPNPSATRNRARPLVPAVAQAQPQTSSPARGTLMAAVWNTRQEVAGNDNSGQNRASRAVP